MKHLRMAMIGLLLAITGCQTATPPKPVWQDVKFKELARAKHKESALKSLEPPFQFNVYIFHVPVDNFEILKTAWDNLARKQIFFKNEEIFNQNGFIAGLGEAEKWAPVSEKLRQADAKNARNVDLIVSQDTIERVDVFGLDSEKNIFYKSQKGQLSGSTIGPGKALLKLSAAGVPEQRGVCNLTVVPAFVSSEKATLAGPEETTFDSMPFTARMSQGDFVLLGPAVPAQEMALGGIFFSAPEKSSIQVFLIVCLKVND